MPWLYRITTILLVMVGVVTGTGNLFQNEQAVTGIINLGYPAYAASILGFFKALGGITILLSLLKIDLGKAEFLKEWAYAGFAILFLGATTSHLVTGDGDALPAIAFFSDFDSLLFKEQINNWKKIN